MAADCNHYPDGNEYRNGFGEARGSEGIKVQFLGGINQQRNRGVTAMVRWVLGVKR